VNAGNLCRSKATCPWRGPAVLDKPMKKTGPHCPLCSEKIVLKQTDFDHIFCQNCEISFAGFEVFDSLPEAGSVDEERILPFGIIVSKGLKLDLLRRLLRNMERVFELVVTGEAPGKACSAGHLMAYLISLVEGQRDELAGIMPGSWALVPEEEIDKSLRDEFLLLPTYLAIGTLSFTLSEMPSFAREIPILRRSLERGLDFATTGGLAGYGHEWLEWRRRILSIFQRGKVLDLLLEQPHISTRMCYVLGYVHERTQEILNKTQGPIEYETRGPVPRDIYEGIARHTEVFRQFCGEDHPLHA
jgi:hypothetical protein